jgi:hypothetical protein
MYISQEQIQRKLTLRDIHLFITPYSVLRQVHYIFRSQFFTQCDLVLPLQFPAHSLCIKVIQWLLTSSSLPFHHLYPSIYPQDCHLIINPL